MISQIPDASTFEQLRRRRSMIGVTYGSRRLLAGRTALMSLQQQERAQMDEDLKRLGRR
jgi:hypothetical protein